MVSSLSRSMRSDAKRIVSHWKISLVHKIEMERLRQRIKMTHEKQAKLRSVQQYINNYRGNSLEDGTLIIGQT